MTVRLPRLAILAVILTVGLPCAQAVQYKQVNQAASKISFTYNQFTSQVYGTFGVFEAKLDFDTANPAAARASLTIQLDSIDAGSSDANTELQKPAWFNSADYPVATFESTDVKALGDNKYTIIGKLTLRGVTRDVAVPVLLKAEDTIGIFDGELTLKRSDFKIGEGEYADTVVSDDINIRFKMVAPQQ
ncbi:polyisoprenoid-binding protein YceI [Pseudomonas sp. 3296]|uniref:YceI family protein n=1 Tax=Pseudomonas sp. 3296 TaxID=2817753 RepID=UPI0028557BDE|nr:YceI family protein [Pseudomonas sp. 3296]MDR6917136.1 polyisoprenoid-binding protein YceI [Pseudomonas sp. 3296]